MDVELIEIRDFLAQQPPFDRLPMDTLDHMPAELSIRYLRRGTPFPPQDADGSYLYVVRTGAIDLRDRNDELVDKLDQGDLYASPCLADDPESSFHGTTVEDTLLYLIPCALVQKLWDQHPPFEEYFQHSIRQRLRRAIEMLETTPGTGNSLITVKVDELASHALVHIAPQATIQQAAQHMNQHSVSSLLVMQGEQLLGLLTDRDLRNRCLAAGLSPQQPVSDIMTPQPHTISAQASGFEALMRMAQHNIHQLPVMAGNNVSGMISVTDLIRHQSAHTVHLIGKVNKCDSVEALATIGKQLPELQVQLTTAGANAQQLGQAISAVSDAVTYRLIALAEETLGAAPIAYTWLACGSQGRQEQTSHTDQDNALLLSNDYQPEHEDYFHKLARFVNDGLNACGYDYCPGEIMASTPKWRQPYSVWQSYFDNWIDHPEPKALMHTSIFFDMRPVHGDQQLYQRLRDHILSRTQGNSLFLAYMAANALHYRPPLGFFRQLVLIHGGEHDHTLGLKRRGIMPIVDLARVYALAGGIATLNTSERLQTAADAELLSRESANDLTEALAFISAMRLRHQSKQIKRGDKPDNYLALEELSRLEQRQLKDAFQIIHALQETIAQRYQTERFA